MLESGEFLATSLRQCEAAFNVILTVVAVGRLAAQETSHKPTVHKEAKSQASETFLHVRQLTHIKQSIRVANKKSIPRQVVRQRPCILLKKGARRFGLGRI